MTYCLAFDHAFDKIGLVLSDQEKQILFHVQWQQEKRFFQSMTSFLDEAFEKTGLAPQDIEVFLVGSGPGSFTSLRLAASLVQSLAMVNRRPVLLANSALALIMDLAFSKKQWGRYCLAMRLNAYDVIEVMAEVSKNKIILISERTVNRVAFEQMGKKENCINIGNIFDNAFLKADLSVARGLHLLQDVSGSHWTQVNFFQPFLLNYMNI